MGTDLDKLTDALNNGTLTIEALEALTRRAEEMKKKEGDIIPTQNPDKTVTQRTLVYTDRRKEDREEG